MTSIHAYPDAPREAGGNAPGQRARVNASTRPRIAVERHGDRLLILIRRGTAGDQRAFMLSFPSEARQLDELLRAELAAAEVTR
jgi:hypothetical protein